MRKNLSLSVVLFLGLFSLLGSCSSSNPGKTSVSSGSEVGKVSIKSADNSAKSQEGVITKNNSAPKSVAALAPEKPDSETNSKVTEYVNILQGEGFSKAVQGVWVEANNVLLANHQGTVPLPAASVTKSATTLAALQTFGPDHQFVTEIATNGSIKNGVLQGDLVVKGAEDPFFVWEEALVVGNILNQKGIKRVTGNLVIVGKFYMNFETQAKTSGDFLKQGLNSEIWPQEAEEQFQTLPPGNSRPQVVIEGSVKVADSAPQNLKVLVRHFSFPVAELTKKMNM